ncbi:hypothetical protein CL634_01950, partial [bacterium]|nr:hypothetical protein [bacterium]
MSVVDIAKVWLVFSNKHQESILEALQRLGWVQVVKNDDTQIKATPENLAKFEYDLAGVNFAINFLSEYDTKKRSLGEKLLPNKIKLSLEEIESKVNEFDFAKISEETQEVEATLNKSKAEIESSAREIEILEPWSTLPFPTGPTGTTDNTSGRLDWRLITVSPPALTKLQNDLKKDLVETQSIDNGNGKNKEVKAYILFSKTITSKVEETLTKYNIKPVDIPALEVTVAQRLADLKQLTASAESQITEAKSKATELASKLDDLKIAFDWLTWQVEKAKANEQAQPTTKTSNLLAWVPKEKIETLKTEIGKITKDFDVIEQKINEDDAVPVLLHNRWAQPFESVTGIYGSPLPNEPDPSPYLAPFFLLFFGLALTDAGYGIMLAAFSYAAIKVMKLPKAKAKLLWVLVYGGIATFVAGALAGGWFGIVLENIPIVWLREFFLKMQIINPVEEPITMLLFALALGVVQVMVGIGIDGFWKLRHGKKLDALFDSGFWLFFIGTILFFSMVKVGVAPERFALTAKYLVWAGAGSLILTQGRRAKNIIGKIGGGVMSLYNLVGYFSDVLSYARILALGLATGII